MTDAELVARARGGDQAAFGELVDRHGTAVHRATRAALGSPAEAEDAAQDAFVLAWRRLATFRADASFKTWLLAIAWRQAITRRRWIVRWWRRTVPIDDTESASPMARFAGSWNEASPEELVGARQLEQDIRRAIRKLSPKLRDALLLAQSGDYSYEEIAAMLGTPLGTIKWRISEARRMVRKALHERGHGLTVERVARGGQVR